MRRYKPAPNALAFDYPRATKLWMLERLPASARVKAFLKALDAFVRDKPQEQVTLRKLALSMGCSMKTARRAAQDARALGWLSYVDESEKANTFTIIWLPIFDLTHKPSEDLATVGSSTPSQAGSPPSQFGSPPSQFGSPPPPNLGVPPSQIGRGAPPPTISTNTRPDHGRSQGAKEPQAMGGLFASIAERQTAPSIPNQKRSWVGHVEPQDLLDTTHLAVLARKAAAAGLLTPGREGLLIVLAAAHHVRHAVDVKNPAALFISIVEGRARYRLNNNDFDHARSVLREITTPAGAIS